RGWRFGKLPETRGVATLPAPGEVLIDDLSFRLPEDARVDSSFAWDDRNVYFSPYSLARAHYRFIRQHAADTQVDRDSPVGWFARIRVRDLPLIDLFHLRGVQSAKTGELLGAQAGLINQYLHHPRLDHYPKGSKGRPDEVPLTKGLNEAYSIL